MIYWIVVLTIWFVSIFLLTFGGALIFDFFLGKVNIQFFYIGALSFSIGFILNFVVVNWPTGGLGLKQPFDKKTLKALKFIAKTAPLAPYSVSKGLKEIIKKYS